VRTRTHALYGVHDAYYCNTGALTEDDGCCKKQDVSTSNTKFMSAPASGPYEYDLAKIQQFV
jgi:hypothetical protein